jgi:hypothetical protein
VSVNGTLIEDKMRRFKGFKCSHFNTSTSVAFTLTTVQVPKLALTHTDNSAQLYIVQYNCLKSSAFITRTTQSSESAQQQRLDERDLGIVSDEHCHWAVRRGLANRAQSRRHCNAAARRHSCVRSR